MARLNRVLQVLRIVIDAPNYYHVLDAPSDVEFACGVQKSEVPSTKPTLIRFPLDTRRKGRGGGHRIMPIAQRDIGPGNPDLADITRPKPKARLRIDNREHFADKPLATACEELGVLLARRRGCPRTLQCISAHSSRHKPPSTFTPADEQ